MCDHWQQLFCLTSSSAPLIAPELSGRVSSVHCFQHLHTGLKLIVADTDSPLVHGYLAVATEAQSDDGCPHTLEHLIFLGSKQFPYKGVLDEVANRNFSQGTNAWTATDHTAYTISTVGSDAFLNVLPVYLDHILFPTLTQAGFVTEVHHITGEGKNAGVVYCEMQARENTAGSLCSLEMVRQLFPGQQCGYNKETGGLMKDIRELTVDTIRNFHQQFYQPSNVCVIVTGKIQVERLLENVDQYLSQVYPKDVQPHHFNKRPWSSTVPVLQAHVQKTVTFPSDDESFGSHFIGWRGPSWKDFETRSALDILVRYLTDSPVAPMQKALVEIEDPICGRIYTQTYDFSETGIMIEFDGVPKHQIGQKVADAAFDILRKIASGEISFEMDRLRSLIEKSKREILNSLDLCPENFISNVAIGFFLYSETLDSDSGVKMFALTAELNTLLTKDEQYWLSLLKQYFIEGFHVSISGTPSNAALEQSLKEEDERIQNQMTRLGSANLERMRVELEEAKAFNEIPIPVELLQRFAVPKLSPDFIPVTMYQNEAARSIVEMKNDIEDPNFAKKVKSLDSIAVPIQIQHVLTPFVTVSVTMDTTNVSSHLKPYLSIFSDLILESSLRSDDGLTEILSSDELIAALEDQTVSYSCGFGYHRSYLQGFSLSINVPANDYSRAVDWVLKLLWNTSYDAEKIKVLVKKSISDSVSSKRDGNSVCSAAQCLLDFQSSHTSYYSNFLVQSGFLEKMLQQLESEDQAASVVADFNSLRDELTSPNNLFFVCVMNLALFPENKDLSEVWRSNQKLQSVSKSANCKSHVLSRCSTMLREPLVGKEAFVISVGGVDSGYLVSSCREVPDFLHPDYATLSVVIEYLTALEGPFWKRIRGLGLAYSYSLSYLVLHNRLQLSLYRATNLVAAYNEARSVVMELASGRTQFSSVSLEGAKSSLIYALVAQVSSPLAAAKAAFVTSVLSKLPGEFRKTLINQVQAVEDLSLLTGTLEKYIVPLFRDPASSNMVIVTGPANAEELCKKYSENPSTDSDNDDGFTQRQFVQHTVESIVGKFHLNQ